jgi:hypothetical protein
MPVDARSVSWTLGELRKLAGSSNAPQWLRQSAGSSIAGVVEREADRAVEEIGDGCVSLDSAHLDGVSDFTVVRANHLSMILNIGGGSRTPLAVPIVLDRLGRPPNAQQ